MLDDWVQIDTILKKDNHTKCGHYEGIELFDTILENSSKKVRICNILKK